MTVVLARPQGARQAIRDAARLGEVVLRADRKFNGVEVFSAERELPEDAATEWIERHRENELVDITVVESRDGASHWIAVVLTYWQS